MTKEYRKVVDQIPLMIPAVVNIDVMTREPHPKGASTFIEISVGGKIIKPGISCVDMRLVPDISFYK
jgi:hypothetical protein